MNYIRMDSAQSISKRIAIFKKPDKGMGQKSLLPHPVLNSPPKSSENNQRALVVLLLYALTTPSMLRNGQFHIPADIELIPPEGIILLRTLAITAQFPHP